VVAGDCHDEPGRRPVLAVLAPAALSGRKARTLALCSVPDATIPLLREPVVVSPQVIAAIIAAGAGVLTVAATVAVQITGRRATSRDTQKALEEQRKQLDRTLAEQRTRTLNERFATAAGQLGGDKPTEVRLAGVYAMAGLADDWPENRQTCVDVLCGYLRIPYEPDPGDEASGPERLAFRASREVRHTVIRVITAHLQAGAKLSWQGLDFDFTGVVFDGGDFRHAEFSGGTVFFDRARFFGGEVSFHNAGFSGGTVSFDHAEFSGGTVDFSWAECSSGEVSFFYAGFSGGQVDFDLARFSGGTVYFGNARFSGGTVFFTGARFSGGAVHFTGAEFSGGQVDFGRGPTLPWDMPKQDGKVDYRFEAEFSGGQVDFLYAKFSGGTVSFRGAKFSGGQVDFRHAELSGGQVDFRHAEFADGTVDFSEPGDWSVPPAFPWTGTPPPGVKLPRKEDQSQT
jgi:uncharacterized protein YjbI with pentapeptide repeats